MSMQKGGLSTTKLIWLVFIGATVMYIPVSYSISQGEPNAEFSLLLPVFIALSMGCAGAAFIMRKKWIAGPIEQGLIDPSDESQTPKLLARYILCWALVESITIYGVMYSMLSSQFLYTASFGAASLVLMLLHIPISGKSTSQ